jgi:hypothetical protein
MLEKIGHVKNPLTVISIFAAIAEISGTIVLPFITTAEHQGTYIWFLMLFPVLLVISFFLTLNFNHRVLYAPSDFKDEKHFLGRASQAEIEEKVEHEALLEISKESIANEAESLDENDELPDGPSFILKTLPIVSKNELVQSSLDFERRVLLNLKKGGVPFRYNSFNEEVSFINGSRKLLIDGVIETNNVHYLIEVKNIIRPSSLVNAVHQIDNYKLAYENYLKENNIDVVVQPVIIVPASVNISGAFRGVPIAKFDEETNTIINLKDSYPDYVFNESRVETDDLASILTEFLNRYSRWGFSPLRIQQWGSNQLGFEKLELYSIDEIRLTLENLLKQRKLTELVSKKGNRLYKISPNKRVN